MHRTPSNWKQGGLLGGGDWLKKCTQQWGKSKTETPPFAFYKLQNGEQVRLIYILINKNHSSIWGFN